MLIGEMPSTAAINENKAFAGNSFSQLKKWFTDGGFRGDENALRRKLYFTSVLKCKIKPENNKLIKHCFANCSRFLWRQIEIVDPTTILILGKTAFDSLSSSIKGDYADLIGTHHGTNALFEGELFPRSASKAAWYIMPHPSGLNRLLNDSLIKAKVNAAMTEIASQI